MGQVIMKLSTLALGALMFAAMASAGWADETLKFRYDGVSYSKGNLPTTLRQGLHEIEVEASNRKRKEIERYVIDLYIAERAVLENRPIANVRQELIFGAPPDDATTRAFYDDNQDRIGAAYDDVKEQLSQFLAQRIAQENVAALLSLIANEKGYTAYIPRPRAPKLGVTTEGYPAKGPGDAAVTLVEFSDFQCPYCRDASTAIDKLIAAYGDQLRVVYRDFPINPSGVSREIAKGGVCAAAQDMFWPYHDRAFALQGELTLESATGLAAELELDTDTFAACLADDATEALVAASEAEALALGVTGTPTIFVGGRLVQTGADLETALAEAIEAELAEQR